MSKFNRGRIFIGGLVEGWHYPKGRKTPIIDAEALNDVIIVSSDYFLKNKSLLELWATKSDKR